MTGKGRGRRKEATSKKAVKYAKGRPIYERQNERDSVWKAFVFYRDADPRSLEVVAEKIGRSVSNVQRMSSLWCWRDRVEEWDRYRDEVRRKVEIKEIEKMRRKHIKLAQGMQQLGALELQRKLKAAEADHEDGQLSAKDLRELIESGAKLERLNRGEPTEHVKNDGEIQVITVGGKAIKF